MTIHELMNKSPVIPEIRIVVFNRYRSRIIYNGLYENAIPYVYNLEVDDYEITGIETQECNPGRYYISAATICADVE